MIGYRIPVKVSFVMKVALLCHTPDPDKTVAIAARRCYSALPSEELDASLTEEKIQALLLKLLKSNHLSPFEHASFTFAIEGVSRSLSHQLVRHRIASYSQESQRYVNYSDKDVEMIVPISIQNDSQALPVYKEAIDASLKAYNELVKMGIPAEDARYLLPNAATTKLVMTMNPRSLNNFIEQRH